MVFDLILKIFNKMTFSFFFNLSLILSFFFYKIILDENIIIGCFSMLILFLIFFLLKESKSETLRQIRRRSKLVFRVQKIILINYSFFYSILSKTYLKCYKRLICNLIFIKFSKLYLKTVAKRMYLQTRLVFLKIFYFNLLTDLVLVSITKIYKEI